MAKAAKTTFLARYESVPRSRIYRAKKIATEDRDREDYELIYQLFEERRQKVGSRQLKMLLKRRFGRVVNRKKIVRLMGKYGMITKIRKSRWKKLRQKFHEHQTTKNILDRNFDVKKPDQVYSVDITELPYGSGKKAYLAAFKDLATREIISKEISKAPGTKFVNLALKNAIYRLPKAKRARLMVHSDQGMQFTHRSFRQILAENKVTQSMSRKGNCLDNAPMESFFGHLKDHLNREETFEALVQNVTKEIEYYNRDRPQWNLKRMPPNSVRRHLNRFPGF